MSKFLTARALADAIDWEGGVRGALDYGVTADDIAEVAPPDVVEAWAALEASQVHMDVITQWLDQIG